MATWQNIKDKPKNRSTSIGNGRTYLNIYTFLQDLNFPAWTKKPARTLQNEQERRMRLDHSVVNNNYISNARSSFKERPLAIYRTTEHDYDNNSSCNWRWKRRETSSRSLRNLRGINSWSFFTSPKWKKLHSIHGPGIFCLVLGIRQITSWSTIRNKKFLGESWNLFILGYASDKNDFHDSPWNFHFWRWSLIYLSANDSGLKKPPCCPRTEITNLIFLCCDMTELSFFENSGGSR